jgi:hypothetical protein
MDTKSGVTVGIVIVVVGGLIWLLNLLPGFGVGRGGAGPGKGPGSGTAAVSDAKNESKPKIEPPQPLSKNDVRVGASKLMLKLGEEEVAVTLEQLQAWTLDGKEFTLHMTDDTTVEYWEQLKKIAEQSEGKIRLAKR